MVMYIILENNNFTTLSTAKFYSVMNMSRWPDHLKNLRKLLDTFSYDPPGFNFLSILR